MKLEILEGRVLLVLLLLTFFSFLVYTETSVVTIAGNITHLNIYGVTNTTRWGGFTGTITGTSVARSSAAFDGIGCTAVNVYDISVPGGNLDESDYYLVLMQYNTSFDVGYLTSLDGSELSDTGIFNSSNYPIFHPSYYSHSDNANRTFCCDNVSLEIGGSFFNAYEIRIQDNVSFSVLKYRTGANSYTPAFVAELGDFTCYDGGACDFQLLLPVHTTKTYAMYYISKAVLYNMTVFVDGTESTTISQTALPYNISVSVRNFYTGALEPNATIAVIEYGGNNLFIPSRLSGVISRGMTYAITDESGIVDFLVAPSEYGGTGTVYGIQVASLDSGYEVVTTENLTITNAGSVVQSKKPISVTALSNNAKVAVNSMSSIVSALYQWINQENRAFQFDVTAYNNGTFSNDSMQLKVGAPNVITITYKNPVGGDLTGYIEARETEGFLVMAPEYNETTELGERFHRHRNRYIPDGTEFIITPTAYGVDSTIKLYVYDSTYTLVSVMNATIDGSIDVSGGTSYTADNTIKTTVNDIATVISSLYYSLN